MAITKPAVRTAWADGAGSNDIQDPGGTFTAAGWPLSNTPPSRQYFNWVLNYCMNAARYFSRAGIPQWDSNESYLTRDICRGSDGMVYQAGLNNQGQDPTVNSGSSNPWGPLRGYVTTNNTYVTASQLAATLTAYVTQSTLNSTLAGYLTTAAYAQNIANYYTASQINSILGGYATAASVSSLSTTVNNVYTASQNASNLITGTVAPARLPNIGTLPGVTIQADPGSVPSGSYGQMFLYY